MSDKKPSDLEKKKILLTCILNLSVAGMIFSMWLTTDTLASKIFWTSFWVMVMCFLEYLSLENEQHIEKMIMTELRRFRISKEIVWPKRIDYKPLSDVNDSFMDGESRGWNAAIDKCKAAVEKAKEQHET